MAYSLSALISLRHCSSSKQLSVSLLLNGWWQSPDSLAPSLHPCIFSPSIGLHLCCSVNQLVVCKFTFAAFINYSNEWVITIKFELIFHEICTILIYFSLVKQSQKKYLALTRALVITSLVLNEAHTMREVTRKHTKTLCRKKKTKKTNMHSRRKKNNSLNISVSQFQTDMLAWSKLCALLHNKVGFHFCWLSVVIFFSLGLPETDCYYEDFGSAITWFK